MLGRSSSEIGTLKEGIKDEKRSAGRIDGKSWVPELGSLDELTVYGKTPEEKAAEYMGDAEAV